VLAGEGPTARALRAPVVRASAAVGATALRIRGATLHNLADLDLDLPASGLVAVTGPSGAGKTSLVHGVIGESRRAGAPVGCRSIAGLDRFAAVRGRVPSGQTLLDALSLLPALQRAFHGAAAGSGLGRGAFSFRSPAGRCPACKGSGVESISMDALADLHLPCPACGGARYRPEVLAARWAELRIDEVLALPAAALHVRLPEGALRGGVAPLLEAGLGHLALGRATRTLSGGELQRLGLAARLQETDGPVLHLLDEPGRGLHEGDLQRLLRLFARLVARGDLLIASVHRERLRCAADVEVALGPGAGAEGGRRVHLGPPRP
jgi:excinuclease ABC subunit A